ncbi:hypothetical protein L1987_78540 [Smallanthus sonchifolius]|uniref:Uncharacterized protein n=1 Tax=Smallanthus sonchifolius TaxID=185202 RepID=A0ACB8ZD76_9ASTR|nr:hypothetical protein L1987_78540 [Smallanthus sonchifolius]
MSMSYQFLLKLETKLTFFTEMDGVVSRAREQLERSKQRLYHQGAQIIAARLGMPGSASSRPMPHLLQRPPNPMSMTPQRPPVSRSMTGPTPLPNPVGVWDRPQLQETLVRLSNQGMK